VKSARRVALSMVGAKSWRGMVAVGRMAGRVDFWGVSGVVWGGVAWVVADMLLAPLVL
jgi:hypothetical protein